MWGCNLSDSGKERESKDDWVYKRKSSIVETSKNKPSSIVDTPPHQTWRLTEGDDSPVVDSTSIEVRHSSRP